LTPAPGKEGNICVGAIRGTASAHGPIARPVESSNPCSVCVKIAPTITVVAQKTEATARVVAGEELQVWILINDAFGSDVKSRGSESAGGAGSGDTGVTGLRGAGTDLQIATR